MKILFSFKKMKNKQKKQNEKEKQSGGIPIGMSWFRIVRT